MWAAAVRGAVEARVDPARAAAAATAAAAAVEGMLEASTRRWASPSRWALGSAVVWALRWWVRVWELR